MSLSVTSPYDEPTPEFEPPTAPVNQPKRGSIPVDSIEIFPTLVGENVSGSSLANVRYRRSNESHPMAVFHPISPRLILAHSFVECVHERLIEAELVDVNDFSVVITLGTVRMEVVNDRLKLLLIGANDTRRESVGTDRVD